MPYHSAMKFMRRTLDKFAVDMAMDEMLPVKVLTPAYPLSPPKEYTVTAVYIPNPSKDVLKHMGIEVSLDGLLYIREKHAAAVGLEFLTEFDGAIKPGYKFIVRGRTFHSDKSFQDRDEIAFVLNDQMERNNG